MMNVDVLSPVSTPWLRKGGPSNTGFEGLVDHSNLPFLGSRLVESVSWLQLAERDALKAPKSRQEMSATLGLTPLKAPSSQMVKNLAIRLGSSISDTVPCDSKAGLYETGGIEIYCSKFEDASFIPGLPDDVAKQCLALLSREDFPSLRSVSRAWWDLVQTQEFYHTRKGVGTLEEWLYVLTVAPNLKSTRWEVLNPKQKDWKALPRMPGLVKVGSGTIVVNEKLLVIGGLVLDDEKSVPSAEVFIYDPVLDRWNKAASMHTARYEFACGVLNGKVYVVGGHGSGEEGLSSMEIYDAEKDEWTCSTSLRRPRWGCFAAGVEGKVYVMGGRSNFTLGSSRCVDVFDPTTGLWTELKNGCAMVLTHAVVNGKIICIEWKDERSLRIYNPAANTWQKVLLPVPSNVRPSFCLGTLGGKLLLFPTTSKKCSSETLVYDPEAEKGSEWQTTSITAAGACLGCATMIA